MKYYIDLSDGLGDIIGVDYDNNRWRWVKYHNEKMITNEEWHEAAHIIRDGILDDEKSYKHLTEEEAFLEMV